jgi:hypothetical protein
MILTFRVPATTKQFGLEMNDTRLMMTSVVET